MRKLTNRSLRQLVDESVRRILIEKHRPSEVNQKGKRIFRDGETYYPAPSDTKDLPTQTMYKVGKIHARPSVGGKMHGGTTLSNGFKEREGFEEKPNHMVVRNPKGEEYQVPQEEFDKKYTIEPNSEPREDGFMPYNAFDERQISDPIKHNMYKNMPNWGPGQRQFAKANNGHFVNPQSDDSYFIGDEELKSTHTSNPKVSESKINKVVTRIINEMLKR